MRNELRLILAAALAAMLALGAGTAAAALPPMKQQGEIQYLSGGVGTDESESIKQAASQFPLALEFVQKATPHGEYLANVAVSVIDHRGRSVLEATSDGPFLLARLPSGEYAVKASYAGRTLEKVVHVADSTSARAVFVWPGER
jgi:hypothetical protein